MELGIMGIGGLVIGAIIGYILVTMGVKRSTQGRIDDANKKADLTLKEAELTAERKIAEAESKADKLFSRLSRKMKKLSRKRSRKQKISFTN